VRDVPVQPAARQQQLVAVVEVGLRSLRAGRVRIDHFTHPPIESVVDVFGRHRQRSVAAPLVHIDQPIAEIVAVGDGGVGIASVIVVALLGGQSAGTNLAHNLFHRL
jgi:hypothetical protein